MMRSCALACLAVHLAGCSVSERFLLPRTEWLAEPDALGLAFEDIVLATGSETTVHGWFIPAPGNDGRTVLLCHGSSGNITFYHPYYRFLHEAGYHVFVFDYRGYGKSQGELDVGALFTDTDAALDYLLTRPDVDASRIALFGASLGAIVALRTAARRPEPAALVVENASSPDAAMTSALGGFLAWWVQCLALPGDLEPTVNAARYDGPALFLCGAFDPDLGQHLEAVAAAAGPARSWVMPSTGHAPSGLLMHDGEYQDAITGFLDACFDPDATNDGEPRDLARIECVAGAVEAGTLEVHLTQLGHAQSGTALPQRVPVELCLVDPDDRTQFVRGWLEGREATWRVPAEHAPRFVSAVAYQRVEAFEDSWRPVPGPLTVAYDLVLLVRELGTRLETSEDPLTLAQRIDLALTRFEQEHGAIPALAATELMPALLSAGRAAAALESEPSRALARRLLQRCIDAEPEHHGLHYWPAARYSVGFPYPDELHEAHLRLAALPPAQRAVQLTNPVR